MLKKFTYLLLCSFLFTNSLSLLAKTRVVHVVVALCDNKYQGIVPVPEKIGNGQDPVNNLYWGAAYGVKTFIKKQPNWQLVTSSTNPQKNILERIVFKHKTDDVYLVADAYDGQYIGQTIDDFYQYIGGAKKGSMDIQQKSINTGGGADMVVYIGHNGLMDYSIAQLNLTAPEITNEKNRNQNAQRQAAVFACKSKPYFLPQFERTGIRPAMMTTNFMAPEAYILNALVDSWIKKHSPEQTREAVAQAYAKYQKISVKSAKGLFATQ
ncbi:hypothetical protein [Limnobaculum xujianqingii]|uniref:hypothetical protein n=1 Tax=Limnobaculum xujianqingii TaxID=2738837 RepID=UPI001E4702DD|nr:hypothetical protein [Limnobaculum xujianqingii]